MNRQDEKYLELLSKEYPTKQAVCKEMINLNAILNLPKGTEHFMSDLHGEYEAFLHILNNCSGVVREKVDLLYKDTMTKSDRQELCTLIYYPREKLKLLKRKGVINDEWYKLTLSQLIEVAKILSSKYTRSKVRKALPEDFGYIIDELLHVQKDEDDNQVRYHQMIIETILEIDNADEFIVALCNLIKRLAVDHLHIIGDIFDRGANAHKIMDLLMNYHSIDIEWGNHDILWMGAACGCQASIATVIRNNLRHGNTEILENGYGISLRHLMLYGMQHFDCEDPMKAAEKEMNLILQKLDGRIIKDHPDYCSEHRVMLEKINYDDFTIELDGETYKLHPEDFPTVDPADPLRLTDEEQVIIDDLTSDFLGSTNLQKHVDFLYEKGSVYRIYNNNLLYHGCVPMDDDGNFASLKIGREQYQGKELFDYIQEVAVRAHSSRRTLDDLDFMYYLWCGSKSPMSGRIIKTFERTYIDDPKAWKEGENPYFKFYLQDKVCTMILHEFGLYSDYCHIVNGHTPVKVKKGETPVRANGKLFVIDGGFCQALHESTGNAGYTLIFNSHGIRLKSHHPFTSVEQALTHNDDIESDSTFKESKTGRIMVRDTDVGKQISIQLEDLQKLLDSYRDGSIPERK